MVIYARGIKLPLAHQWTFFELAIRRSFLILFFHENNTIENDRRSAGKVHFFCLRSILFWYNLNRSPSVLATSPVLLFGPYCVVKQLIKPQVLIMESMYRLCLLPIG